MSIFIWIVIFTGILWAFLLLIGRLFDLESRGISLEPGVLIWRTKHGLGVLDRISNAWRDGWKVFGILAAGAGIILMFLMVFGLAGNTFVLLTREGAMESASGGVYLALPGITIPFVAGIIGLATVLIVHEPAHGIVLRRLGLRTKSTGLLLFLIIPGAFVEEDEEEFQGASVSKRLQVAGAGPFANVLFGLLCLLVVLALVTPIPGLIAIPINENMPAARAGMETGARLKSIDGTRISGLQDLTEFMDGTRPGESVTLYTEENRYRITLGDHPEENTGYLGVYLVRSAPESDFLNPLFMSYAMILEIRGQPIINSHSYSAPVPWFLIDVLKWMFVLNVAIGLFNLLPLGPLDGGHIASGILEKLSSRHAADVGVKILTAFTLIIIILNFLPAVI